MAAKMPSTGCGVVIAAQNLSYVKISHIRRLLWYSTLLFVHATSNRVA